MEGQPCVFLGIKVKPGPIERHKVENFALENTVENLKSEAEKKSNLPSTSLELIYHGKILKDASTLQDSGVKSGEMVHVVKKKVQVPVDAPQTYTDAELQQIVTAMRTFGCTPNAPGWTRAMQMLNDEATMSEIIEAVPPLAEECLTLSILHEVELLAALGANVHTMRRGADARPALPAALRHLTRLVRSRSNNATASADTVPTSGFAYSLEALSEDEDGDEEGEGEEGGERNTITQEQLAAALQAATESVSERRSTAQDNLLRLLQEARGSGSSDAPAAAADGVASRSMITPEMFSEAISEAITRAGTSPAAAPPAPRLAYVTPMEQSTAASSSQSPSANAEGYFSQLQHMHEMGLLDDALNVRALLICSGDVNAAINLVFSGAIGDD